MKRMIHNPKTLPYSLHDMNINAFEIIGDKLVVKSQSGLVETLYPYRQVEGRIEFHGVQWDFCYDYCLGFDGNVGTFTGKKMHLKDFVEATLSFGFSMMDETYGFNQAKYNGYLLANHRHCECMVEIVYHQEMIYVVED